MLGVSRNCSNDEIKRAYRQKALQWHPDKVSADRRNEAEEVFKDIKQAYELLYDADRRRLYDQYGPASLDPDFEPNRAPPIYQPQGSFIPQQPSSRPFAPQSPVPQAQGPFPQGHIPQHMPQRPVYQRQAPQPVPQPPSRSMFERSYSQSHNFGYVNSPLHGNPSTPDLSRSYYHPQSPPPQPTQNSFPFVSAGHSTPHVFAQTPTYFPGPPSAPNPNPYASQNPTRFHTPPSQSPMRPSPSVYYHSPPGTPIMPYSSLPSSPDYSPRVQVSGDYFGGVQPSWPGPHPVTHPPSYQGRKRTWFGMI